eukprot:jgi/Ulvmu1/4640/UM002_0371.1
MISTRSPALTPETKMRHFYKQQISFNISYPRGRNRPVWSQAQSQEEGVGLQQELQNLDDTLKASNVSDVDLQQRVVHKMRSLAESGQVVGFGKARAVPKRLYTIEELRLNRIDSAKLLSPTEESVGQIEAQLQISFLLLLVTIAVADGDISRASVLGFAMLFLLTLDQISLAGGLRALAIDTVGGILNPDYRKRVAFHEAGHFLVAYLTGLLPLAYTLSSLDAFMKYRTLNVQAGCRFADEEFNQEVQSGKVKASSLNKFSCVALAGVCSEYIKYGGAEGGKSDIQQLDVMLKGLQFTQKKADLEIRWAVLNVISILRRHSTVHESLAHAMSQQATIGDCIQCIEAGLETSDDV